MSNPQTANWFAIVIGSALVYGVLFWWIIRSQRRWNPKAKTQRRLLVKDQDGLPAWRTVRARVLVGWVNTNRTVTSGEWAKSEPGIPGGTWAVLQAAKGKLLAYRFDDYNPEEPDAPKTGVIQVCDSWRELESAVPASIFERALLAAGIKKPSEYHEAPLEL